MPVEYTAQEKVIMLRDTVMHAKEMVAEWGMYATPYFQEKWNLQGDIDHLQLMLDQTA